MANVGRISGQLLKSNLLRDDDLAIDNDLLYLKVGAGTRFVGINNATPGYELDVTGTINSTSLRVGSLTVDELLLDNNKLTTTIGDIEIAPATGTDFITLTGNTNLTGDLEVTGNIHATGNITADGGAITLGDDIAQDNIVFNAEIASHLIPDADVTYDLGSPTKKWRSLYISGQTINLGDLQLKDSGDGKLQIVSGGQIVGELGGFVEASGANIDDNLTLSGDRIATTVTNSNLFISAAGTGEIVLESSLRAGNITVDDDLNLNGNRISTTVSNSNLELSAAGTGIVDVVGTLRASELQVGFTTTITDILDEDTLVSNRDNALATQQSIKAYVDSNISNTVSTLVGDAIILGTPSDGVYTDGAYTSVNPTGYISEAIDQLNETMLNIRNNTFVRSVSFVGTPNAGGEGTTVTLNLTIDGNPNRYDIDWGDGSVTNGTTDNTPSHTYTSNTNSPYTVEVRAYNNTGTGYGSEALVTNTDYIIIYTADPAVAFGLYTAASGGSAITGNNKYVIEGNSLYLENITTNTLMADVTYTMNWGDGTALDNIADDTANGGVSGTRLQHTWAPGTNTGTSSDTLTLTLVSHTTATPELFPISVTNTLKVYNPNIATPNGLSTKTISITGTDGISPKLAAGFTDATSVTALTAGATVDRVDAVSGNIETTTTTLAYDADAGTLSALVNGVADGAVVLGSGSNAGTTDSLAIVSESDFNLFNATGGSVSFAQSIYHPGLYTGFTAKISKSATTVSAGVNSLQLSHSVTGNTNTVEFVKDDVNVVPVVTGGTLSQSSAGTLRYISGIPYYNTGASLLLSGVTANSFIGQTYADISDVIEITSAANLEGTTANAINEQNYTYAQVDGTTSFLTGGIPNANTGNGTPYAFGDLTVNVNAANARTIEQLRYRVRNVNGSSSYVTMSEAVQLHSAAQSGISEIAIAVADALGNGTYIDDGKRIFDFAAETISTPAFNSATNFYTNNVYTESADPGVTGTKEATLRLGVLKHSTDNFSNFLPSGPDRSADTGTQYFTFAFRRQVVANFDINITSSTGVSGVWIAAPGTAIDAASTLNGWLNCSAVYNGSGVPGANTGSGGNGSDGCATTTGERIVPAVALSGSYTMTLGTENLTNATNNVALVRIALAVGQSITALSIS